MLILEKFYEILLKILGNWRIWKKFVKNLERFLKNYEIVNKYREIFLGCNEFLRK